MNKIFTKLTVVLLFLVGGISAVSAQTSLKLGLSPFSISSSAALEIESTTRGFLPPRVATETSVSNPATGLMVYNATNNALLVNTGTESSPVWFSTTSDAVPNILTKTGNYSVATVDHTILCDAATAGFTLTLPAAASSPGRIIVIGKIDDTANAVTFTPTLKIGKQTVTTLNYPKKPFRIQSNGTDWIVVDDF